MSFRPAHLLHLFPPLPSSNASARSASHSTSRRWAPPSSRSHAALTQGPSERCGAGPLRRRLLPHVPPLPPPPASTHAVWGGARSRPGAPLRSTTGIGVLFPHPHFLPSHHRTPSSLTALCSSSSHSRAAEATRTTSSSSTVSCVGGQAGAAGEPAWLDASSSPTMPPAQMDATAQVRPAPPPLLLLQLQLLLQGRSSSSSLPTPHRRSLATSAAARWWRADATTRAPTR